MADDKKFDLSRRKVLGSIGTIGVASAAAGAGTMAYFNDTETSTSNTVQAGTLDLVMDWHYTANQDIAGTQEGSGGAGASFTIGDLKPGDDGQVKVDFKPKSNPAWIWLKMEQVADNDHYDTEPENASETGQSGTDGNGEIDELMNAKLTYENGDVIQGKGSLNGVLDALDGGILLDSNRNNSSDDHYDANHWGSVILEWDIPTGVGNVIQGDNAKFDIKLFAEQARHNSNPSNPF